MYLHFVFKRNSKDKAVNDMYLNFLMVDNKYFVLLSVSTDRSHFYTFDLDIRNFDKHDFSTMIDYVYIYIYSQISASDRQNIEKGTLADIFKRPILRNEMLIIYLGWYLQILIYFSLFNKQSSDFNK